MLTEDELAKVRSYIKKQIKKIREGSTTAGVPGYLTPKAFSDNPDSEGTQNLDLDDDQYAYSLKAPKEKINFVKLHELSYQEFREDQSATQSQKINTKILEANRTLREISRALDHSLKLKQESNTENVRFWKKTNEAIDKIRRRVAEINFKAGKLAGLKEGVSEDVEQKIVSLFRQAQIPLTTQDVEYRVTEAQFDVVLNGEPYALNFNEGNLVYEGYEADEPLGNIYMNPSEVVENIKRIFGNE
jgi:methyl-accepting chemotaxis protein